MKLNLENKKKYVQIIAKAWADEEYKKKLLANPTEVFKEEGLELPESINIKMLEDTEDEQVLILPRVPEKELTVEEIEQLLE
jgi:hypothetical protein